jgi:hypothetical protein
MMNGDEIRETQNGVDVLEEVIVNRFQAISHADQHLQCFVICCCLEHGIRLFDITKGKSCVPKY